jgi:hypothetical protein
MAAKTKPVPVLFPKTQPPLLVQATIAFLKTDAANASLPPFVFKGLGWYIFFVAGPMCPCASVSLCQCASERVFLSE